MAVLTDIRPGKKRIKRIYVAVMLWVVGRAIQVAARVDKDVKKEFEELPEGYTFYMGIYPHGPYMVVGKNEKGQVKFMGMNPSGINIDLRLIIKSMEAAILVFTFQESTCVAFARERFVADGELPYALGIVRVLNRIETLLLPKIVTKLAVKRYPKWSELNPARKWFTRVRVYLGIVTG